MHATDAKMQKIEPDMNIFLTDESFRAMKLDWHNVRSYLFFYVQNFRIKISDSVCNGL